MQSANILLVLRNKNDGFRKKGVKQSDNCVLSIEYLRSNVDIAINESVLTAPTTNRVQAKPTEHSVIRTYANEQKGALARSSYHTCTEQFE